MPKPNTYASCSPLSLPPSSPHLLPSLSHSSCLPPSTLLPPHSLPLSLPPFFSPSLPLSHIAQPLPPTQPPALNIALRTSVFNPDTTFENDGGMYVTLSVTGSTNFTISLLVSSLSFDDYFELCSQSPPTQILEESQGLGRASELDYTSVI